jgi:hypothetical protein
VVILQKLSQANVMALLLRPRQCIGVARSVALAALHARRCTAAVCVELRRHFAPPSRRLAVGQAAGAAATESGISNASPPGE